MHACVISFVSLWPAMGNFRPKRPFSSSDVGRSVGRSFVGSFVRSQVPILDVSKLTERSNADYHFDRELFLSGIDRSQYVHVCV